MKLRPATALAERTLGIKLTLLTADVVPGNMTLTAFGVDPACQPEPFRPRELDGTSDPGAIDFD